MIDDLLPQPTWPQGHAAQLPKLIAELAGNPRLVLCELAANDERLAQEISNVSFKEYWLQDAYAQESCYAMIRSRAKTRFPLSDQEFIFAIFIRL